MSAVTDWFCEVISCLQQGEQRSAVWWKQLHLIIHNVNLSAVQWQSPYLKYNFKILACLPHSGDIVSLENLRGFNVKYLHFEILSDLD